MSRMLVRIKYAFSQRFAHTRTLQALFPKKPEADRENTVSSGLYLRLDYQFPLTSWCCVNIR